MAEKSKQVRDRAEAQFKKTEQVAEGRPATVEYRTDAVAMREKTARLRGLRLAKEAADAAAADAAAAEPPSKPGGIRKPR